MVRALVVGVVIGVIAAIGATPAGAGNRIFGIQDCGQPNVKPKRIVFACADAGLYANHFDWHNWGEKHATSDGVMHAKVCEPSCAGGYFKDYPVELTQRHIQTVNCGGKRIRLYTKLKIDYVDSPPPGLHDGSVAQGCF